MRRIPRPPRLAAGLLGLPLLGLVGLGSACASGPYVHRGVHGPGYGGDPYCRRVERRERPRVERRERSERRSRLERRGRADALERKHSGRRGGRDGDGRRRDGRRGRR